ncbi:hypothetical protein BH23GEM2_BH23GEM2_12960 [soil metagenome]
MRSTQILAVTVATVALAACNPFHRDPVTEVRGDANVNTRWTATLATPSNLVGAVQINGDAIMQPRGSGETHFALNIANATPGGLHPWQVRRGQCGSGSDYGVVGSTSDYESVRVGDNGRGESNAVIQMATPTYGNYFVTVQASAANSATIACGNLSPPTR